LGQVTRIVPTKIAAKISSAAMMLSMYEPTLYPRSPRSSSSPQVGQRASS
jgi:hypothetical protein